jgi:hypothetical protein
MPAGDEAPETVPAGDDAMPGDEAMTLDLAEHETAAPAEATRPVVELTEARAVAAGGATLAQITAERSATLAAAWAARRSPMGGGAKVP